MKMHRFAGFDAGARVWLRFAKRGQRTPSIVNRNVEGDQCRDILAALLPTDALDLGSPRRNRRSNALSYRSNFFSASQITFGTEGACRGRLSMAVVRDYRI